MRIHITTTAPEQAAVEIMEQMESHGGQWIVNAVGKEGYILARGDHAKQLLRSGLRTLVGPLDASMLTERLHGLIDPAHTLSVNEGGRKKKKDDGDKRGEPILKQGTQQRVLAELRQRTGTARELAERLGVSRGIAMNAVQKLLKSKRAVIVGRVATPNVKATCVYGIAA